MARPKKSDGPQNGGPITPPDFDKAAKIYREDVTPANKAQKQAMNEASTAWKAIKKDCRVHKGGFQQAMKISEMEEAEQQAYLRSLNAGLKQRGVVMHADAVDRMQGVNGDEVAIIPTGSAPKTAMPVVN